MELKKLTIACTLACAVISGEGFANAPLTAFSTPDVEVYLAGSSELQNFVGAITTGMFEYTPSHPIYVFKDNGGTLGTTADDGRRFIAYFGVINDRYMPMVLSGKSALIVVRASGGFGVDSVARAQAIQTMDVSATGCTSVSGTNYACNIVGKDPGQVGYPAGGEVVPDFGVSLVEVGMFKFPLNVKFGQDQLTPGESAVLGSYFGVNRLLMGLPVTNAVPATTYLSRAAYGAMLSGLITDWNLVDSTIPAGSPVTVCRRVQGSGTQASYNWFFNNFPCSTGSIAGSGSTQPARMSDSASYFNGTVTGAGTGTNPFVITAADGYTVVENPDSSDVAICLSKAQNGGNHDFKGDDGLFYRIAFGAGGHRAIGTLSLASAGKENGWKYRTMDGAGSYVYDPATSTGVTTGTGLAPSKFNLREGRYDFAVEVDMQNRNAVVNGVPVLTGLKKTFVDGFINRASHPEALAAISSAPLRDAVIALRPTFDPTDAIYGSNVAKGTRHGNTCAPLQLY